MKGEISWKKRSAEGIRQEVYAHRAKDGWRFFVREGRYEQWEPLPHPSWEDWLALLDGVKRRINRQLVEPEEEQRVRRLIRHEFPEADI